MPDLTLHGNGEECPACALQREALDADHSLMVRPTIPCQLCGSVGRVARSPEAIVREAVAEARRSYWPQQEARWAAHNAKGAG